MVVADETVFYINPAQNDLLATNSSYTAEILYEGGPTGLAYSMSAASVGKESCF